jgi:hypothetical protein
MKDVFDDIHSKNSICRSQHCQTLPNSLGFVQAIANQIHIHTKGHHRDRCRCLSGYCWC